MLSFQFVKSLSAFLSLLSLMVIAIVMLCVESRWGCVCARFVMSLQNVRCDCLISASHLCSKVGVFVSGGFGRWELGWRGGYVT